VWRADDLPTIEVEAEVTEELGSEVNILFRVDAPPVATEETRAATDQEEQELLLMGDERAVFCARVDARTACKPGGRVTLSLDPSRFHFFDPGTGAAIEANRAAATV
jgi:multiple sugar transport system ATP-binding protein